MSMSLRAPSVRHTAIPTALALRGSRRTGRCARAVRAIISLLNVRSVWVTRLCVAKKAARRAIMARTPLVIKHALSWSAELLACEHGPIMDNTASFATWVPRGGLGPGYFWVFSIWCPLLLGVWVCAVVRAHSHESTSLFQAFFSGLAGYHSTMVSATGLKSLQANMDHTRDAKKLLVEHMTRGGIAFAFVSDPYTWADRIPNVPHSITIFHAPLVVDISCEGAAQSFILVATYAPPHRPLDPILDELAQCFSRFPSRDFIFAGDFNAKHPLWGPASSYVRGVQLVQFACANELHVLNSPDSPPTFDTPYASSWIDVSLASFPLTRDGFVWSVSESDTLCDRRYIEFTFSGATGVRTKRLTNFARGQILDSFNRSV
ncbi:hypothetical protein HPB49_019945 [Dermacentor silvarum]|uniref:Uncharacterized protein n=1 Tax=Dermacentor silvarum TaxID=543639 RepID=A0ACB8DFU6_DERSI|nr:hypothetical protein HPB49_019945 [Dermacentor silvarum]